MQKSDIKELHFITHIANVPSILKRGIVARNKAKKDGVAFADISEPGVQDRRANKKIPGTSRVLHDYANLYFDAHNPMLSARRSENDRICVLKIDKKVLDLKGVVITDQNAARDCWFKSVDEGLPLLVKEEVFLTFWIDRNDSINHYRREGIKCAEILVPDSLEARYIIGAYVANPIALDAFQRICHLPVELKNGLFFY